MTVSILVGDVRDKLRSLPADSFDCVVTSPPYWGLRDYGTGKWVGGDPSCDHRESSEDRTNKSRLSSTIEGGKSNIHRSHQFKGSCGKCGAERIDGQIGLEPTMAEHLAVMVDVFREVRRVLKPSGVLFLNYGDCYATSPNGRSAADTKAAGNDDRTFRDKPFSTIGGALKAKDLCMIPNRLAIALQDDGWWVRSEIIWGKPNPMPESIKDRPATAHEKIFMLTKSARYFYAADEVRQGASETSHGGAPTNAGPKLQAIRGDAGTLGRSGRQAAIAAHAVGSSVSNLASPHAKVLRKRGRPNGAATFEKFGHNTSAGSAPDGSRSLRNWEPAPPAVWIMGTSPFSEAHFATFPPELVERCLEAGCPKGGSVLDPFGGAGTTALVADQMQLDATIIELNPDYVHIAVRRIEADRGEIQNVLDPLQVDLLQGAA